MSTAVEIVTTMGAFVVCTGVGAAFAMLMIVMRGLLRKAADLQAEMAEVV